MGARSRATDDRKRSTFSKDLGSSGGHANTAKNTADKRPKKDSRRAWGIPVEHGHIIQCNGHSGKTPVKTLGLGAHWQWPRWMRCALLVVKNLKMRTTCSGDATSVDLVRAFEAPSSLSSLSMSEELWTASGSWRLQTRRSSPTRGWSVWIRRMPSGLCATMVLPAIVGLRLTQRGPWWL